MNKIPFSKVQVNQFFVWSDWLQQKIDRETAIAVGFAASNGMDSDIIVSVFDDDELVAIKTGGVPADAQHIVPRDITKALGQSISDKGVPCPRCNADQNMFCIGDCEHTLFCPHCDLEVELRLTDSRDNPTTEVVEGEQQHV